MNRGEDLFQRIKDQGTSAIEELIHARQAEELFLDFKWSADNGGGRRLHVHDRNNLAKAISGFGNSEGRLIIWGVDCSTGFDGSDVATAEYPITDAKRFVSWLEGAISGATVPPHAGVQNHPIEIGDADKGFVATYIPQSDYAPHQEIPSRRYYIRAGSDFAPTPHDVLAGMFGRRPQPKIKVNPLISPPRVGIDREWIAVPFWFHICNEGRGIAESLFTTINLGRREHAGRTGAWY